jgi:hypothetical protein
MIASRRTAAGADPDVGHARQPRPSGACRSEADQRAERREQQRQRHHQRHQPGRHAQLDDHHAVERAHQQHQRHADRHLEQRQAQQRPSGSSWRGRVGKRQEARPHPPAQRSDSGCELARRIHGAPAPGLRRVEAAGDALRPRAACQPCSPARRSAGAAGASRHRHDGRARGRRAGTACPRVHRGISSGVRGAKVNRPSSRAGALGPAGSTRTASGGAVVDQRIHRHHVVELAQRRVEHVAAAEVDAAAPRRRAALARPAPPAWATGRWPPPRRRGARPRRPARRCRSRHPAGAGRAGRPAARQQRARMRSRPARTVARMRPTGASRSALPGLHAVRSK